MPHSCWGGEGRPGDRLSGNQFLGRDLRVAAKMRALLIKPGWGIMLSVKTEAAGMWGGKGGLGRR